MYLKKSMHSADSVKTETCYVKHFVHRRKSYGKVRDNFFREKSTNMRKEKLFKSSPKCLQQKFYVKQ
jgi:hypothetical protein